MNFFKNVILALWYQGPFFRFLKNLFNGKMLGLFHPRSHYRDNGEAKISYSQKSALKAKQQMMDKKNRYFSAYKCMFCDGWHIGANRYLENKK